MPRIYAVHDTKAEAYLQPFFLRTKGEAIRSFSEECKKTGSPFNAHSSDFSLYELGEYDELSASIVCHKSPLHLANAAEFIN